MNWLLGLPARFISTILRFFTNLGNPFRMLGSVGRSFKSQIQYIANLPGRYLKLPKGGSGGGLLQDMRDSLSYRSDPAIAKRVKVGETAQYSQIHLTDETTKTRTVIHIGTTIGRSSSEITVGTVGSTRLRFTQID